MATWRPCSRRFAGTGQETGADSQPLGIAISGG
jgi:hypothetical protein